MFAADEGLAELHTHLGGAVASDIYNNKIVSERSYMQATNTRIVTFEMCGNDGLQARKPSRVQVSRQCRTKSAYRN